MKLKLLNIRTEDNMINLLKDVSESSCESYSSYVRKIIRENIRKDYPSLYSKYY